MIIIRASSQLFLSLSSGERHRFLGGGNDVVLGWGYCPLDGRPMQHAETDLTTRELSVLGRLVTH